MSQHKPYHTVVARLRCLTDAELCAVVAQAQSLLLDRPGTMDGTLPLSVEVVTGDEAWLLAHYRALPQRAQRHVLQSLHGAGRGAAG